MYIYHIYEQKNIYAHCTPSYSHILGKSTRSWKKLKFGVNQYWMFTRCSQESHILVFNKCTFLDNLCGFFEIIKLLRISFLHSSHTAYPQSSPSGSQTKTIVCRKSWVGLLASVEMIGWKIKWLPGLGGLGPPAHQTDLTSTDGMFWAPFNGSVSPSLLPIIPPPSPRTIRFLDITFSWLGRGQMGIWSMQNSFYRTQVIACSCH